MSAPTLDATARESVASACDDVYDAGEADLVDGVAPALVARPASTDQVAEVLRAAASHGLTVVPRGRGTKMTWTLPPTSVDLVVDVSRMDQVLDHAAGDLIVDTQAGARLGDLQEVVGRQGQRLALDETVPGASIGGVLATNSSGPSRHVTGTARDLLIGITVVRADGVVAKAGGRVVKNVAGYDLGKLMIGSFGTLGVITEAVFRLHPLADVRRWVTVPVADPAGAHDVVQAVVHSQAVPTAVELDWSADGSGTVAVLLAGRAAGVAGRAQTVTDLLGETSTTVGVRAGRLVVVPLDRGADRAQAHLRALRPRSGARGRPRGRRRAPRLGRDRRAVRRAAGRPRRRRGGHRRGAAPHRVRAAQGGAVVVDGPADVKQQVDVWGPVPALDLMHRVKDRFDPDHRLSPGRFVGGI